MAVISGILKDPIGGPRVGVVIELRAVRTSATVVNQARSQSITDAAGKYSLTVEPGAYDVNITAGGRQPERVGGITVALNSQTGTLNDFLTIPGEADLNPAIVETVDRMRADTAASAAAAKTSETNAAAAMSNALSKVVTTDQSVASTVLFTKPLRLSTASNATGFTPTTQGGYVSWNRKTAADNGITGATDFINHAGTFSGGWNFYHTDGVNTTLAAKLGAAGYLTISGGVISTGDQQMRAGSTTPNLLLRLRDAGDVEKAAIYCDTSTGQLTFRWNGTTYSIICKPDGTVTFPSTVYSGSNALLKTGDYGVGSSYPIVVTDADASVINQYFRYPSNTTGAPNASTWAGHQGGYDSSTRWAVAYSMGVSTVDMRVRCRSVAAWGAWVSMWHTGNTTVDANGFLKKASPIVKLFSDGTSELNDQSQGVITERVSEGVYRVSGTLGFSSDPAWGGPNGGIGLPRDNNDLTLIWVDYEVDESGNLLIKTFHRINSTAPKFAQNVKTGYKEGQPIDIPAGRWIDLRVEMPAGDEPEPIPEPDAVSDTDQQPEAETEQPATPEPGNGDEPDQGDTPEAETKE